MPHRPVRNAVRARLRIFVATVLILFLALGAGAKANRETPMLAEQVAAGKLPPVEERLPKIPLVADFSAEDVTMGRHGGTLRTLISQPRDVRYMAVFGYARLVGRDRDLNLKADILEKYEVKDGRVFTLHLRPGHRWSDGHPFTTEDFRYYWDDVANNPELSPSGPPAVLMAAGEMPKVEVLSETVIRYSWSRPNPAFLPELAQARPPFIYRPAHYLRQFHIRYGDPDRLHLLTDEAKARNWAALHNRLDNMYKFDNIDMPTLQPWVNTTRSPAARYVFTRNPYYHRVDAQGRQLPYIDKVVMTIADGRLIPAKANAGETDLQARGLSFGDVTILKQGEQRSGYTTRLWPLAIGSHVALYPNLNYVRAEWRALFRDIHFRHALSLGIDRHMINRSLYFGLAKEGNNTALAGSSLFRADLLRKWAHYAPDEANRILDQMGLKRRDATGIRLLQDGSPMRIIVETAGETTEQTDILQLVAADWRRIGIDLFIKPSQRDVLRRRVYSGRTMMSLWSGLDTGRPEPDMPPDELAPMAQDNLQWPAWGQYYQTNGTSGEPPDIPQAQELLSLALAWRSATAQQQRRIWEQMLELHAEQTFTIGIVSGVRQPVVVSNRLRNVPEEAHYGWNPGAQFGIYRPDQFWFDDKITILPPSGGTAANGI